MQVSPPITCAPALRSWDASPLPAAPAMQGGVGFVTSKVGGLQEREHFGVFSTTALQVG